MLANTASLVGTSLVTLSLGFVYWRLAAHRFPARSVGIGAAGISAMMLLATISVLGFGTLLIAELSKPAARRGDLLATAIVITGAVGLVLGAGFAMLMPTISPHLASFGKNAETVSLFALGVALTTIGLVLDQALIGILRGMYQFWRNVVLGVSKLVLLGGIATYTSLRSGLIIYGTWVTGILLSLAFLALAFSNWRRSLRQWHFDWKLISTLKRVALWHHGINLGLQVPVFALPVIVTALLSPEQGAYFYTAWMFATVVFVIPLSLSTVLFAMSAAQPAALRSRMRQTIGHSVTAGLAAVALVFIAGPWVLGLFGAGYALHASASFRILILAVFPLIVRYHFVAVSRVFGLLRRAAFLVAATSVLELSGAIIGGEIGNLVGLTVGWVTAVCLEAVVMSPLVYRVMAGGRPGRGSSQTGDPLFAPVLGLSTGEGAPPPGRGQQ